ELLGVESEELLLRVEIVHRNTERRVHELRPARDFREPFGERRSALSVDHATHAQEEDRRARYPVTDHLAPSTRYSGLRRESNEGRTTLARAPANGHSDACHRILLRSFNMDRFDG